MLEFSLGTFVVGSALGLGLAETLKWLGSKWLSSLRRVSTSACGHALDIGTCVKPLDHEGLHGDGTATWSSEGYYWLDKEVVYDSAGNVHFVQPPRHRVAVPVEYVEVATNALSDVGFVAMSVRLREGFHGGEQYDYVVDKVEAASAQLCDELRWCGECQRWGGVHAVGCDAVAEMVDMGVESMMCEHKEDKERSG